MNKNYILAALFVIFTWSSAVYAQSETLEGPLMFMLGGDEGIEYHQKGSTFFLDYFNRKPTEDDIRIDGCTVTIFSPKDDFGMHYNRIIKWDFNKANHNSAKFEFQDDVDASAFGILVPVKPFHRIVFSLKGDEGLKEIEQIIDDEDESAQRIILTNNIKIGFNVDIFRFKNAYNDLKKICPGKVSKY